MNNKYLMLLAFVLIITNSACKKETTEPSTTPESPVVKPNEPAINKLDRPIALSATKGVWGTKIALSWVAMPLAKKYQVYKFDDVIQQYTLLKETQETTIDDAVSSALVKYFYKVKIYNSATVYSDFSDVDYGYTSGKTYNKYISFGS
jgi:hypothetical protein